MDSGPTKKVGLVAVNSCNTIQTLLDINAMIDIHAKHLEGLRTQCSTSAELIQQEIRTIEVIGASSFILCAHFHVVVIITGKASQTIQQAASCQVKDSCGRTPSRSPQYPLNQTMAAGGGHISAISGSFVHQVPVFGEITRALRSWNQTLFQCMWC